MMRKQIQQQTDAIDTAIRNMNQDMAAVKERGTLDAIHQMSRKVDSISDIEDSIKLSMSILSDDLITQFDAKLADIKDDCYDVTDNKINAVKDFMYFYIFILEKQMFESRYQISKTINWNLK